LQRLDHSWQEQHKREHRSMHKQCLSSTSSCRTGHEDRSGSSSNHSCWLHSSSKQERHTLGHKPQREQHKREHRLRQLDRSWQRELHKLEHRQRRLDHSWQQVLHKLGHSSQQERHMLEHSWQRELHKLGHKQRRRGHSWRQEPHRLEHTHQRRVRSWQRELHKRERNWQPELHKREHIRCCHRYRNDSLEHSNWPEHSSYRSMVA
jgi:hypothetical protein